MPSHIASCVPFSAVVTSPLLLSIVPLNKLVPTLKISYKLAPEITKTRPFALANPPLPAPLPAVANKDFPDLEYKEAGYIPIIKSDGYYYEESYEEKSRTHEYICYLPQPQGKPKRYTANWMGIYLHLP